ncbi:MAG: hypothetical protein DCC52_17980, partial [Chloroflexi bacterium]
MDILGTLFNTIVYNPMLNAMMYLYSFIPNYGIAIIVFTLIIGVATMPFRIKSQQSMKAQQANPFNMGCLLTLLPFPIFIGMYQVITAVMGDRPEQMMQLPRHLYANFLNVAALLPVNSNFLGLDLGAILSTQNLLIAGTVIVVVVGTQFVQTKMMQTPGAAMDPQQAQMNQSMTLMMPLMFGFFVWSAPIGLSLYWITFSVIGIIQQGLTGGWSGLTNLLPKRAPEPVRTKRSAGSATLVAP